MDDINQTNESVYKDSPVVCLNKSDFGGVLVKIGTLLYLTNNKNISPTFLFLSVAKEEPLQLIFRQLTGIATTIEVLKNILHFYPNLLKSKIILEKSKKAIKKQQKKKNQLIF